MSKDNTAGLRTALKECSYNKEHNFNLLSMSRLIKNQGCKITKKGITNGKGGVINFDVLVPTEKGAIYAS